MSKYDYSVEYHFLLRSITQFNSDLQKLTKLLKNLPEDKKKKILIELETVKENIQYIENLY
jgi:hypothetical protein